jgi:hypothetical protein
VKDAIAELIETLPPDLSDSPIEILVEATIQAVLEPLHQSERRKRAIARAVEVLPPDAKGRGTPTDWQRAASEFAAAAIGESCPTGSEDEMVNAAQPCIDQIIRAFEPTEVLKSVLRHGQMTPDEFTQVAGKLKKQPIGTPREMLGKTRNDILETLRKAEGR